MTRPFDDGELLDNELDQEVDPSAEDDQSLGDNIDSEDDDQQDGSGQEPAANGKKYNELATIYANQRVKMGLPIDLFHYEDEKSLEAAIARDKKKAEKKGLVLESDGEPDDDADDLDSMNTEDLQKLLQTQQQNIMQTLGMVPGQSTGQNPQVPQQGFVQAPNQGYPLPYQQTPQGGQQQIPTRKPHTYDNWRGDPEEWFNNELLTKGPVAILEMVREEIDCQGPQLGYALANILGPMSQQVQEVRSQVDYDREAISLEKKLKKDGDSLDNYEDELAMVYKQYPALARIKGGIEKALELAKPMKALKKKQTSKPTNKGAVRMPSGGGTGVSKGAPRRRETEVERIHRETFGDSNKPRGVFDD